MKKIDRSTCTDCYNEYLTVTHNLIGDGTCSDMIAKRETLGITQLNDTYRLISYLSWRDKSCGGGLLFVVIKDIVCQIYWLCLTS